LKTLTHAAAVLMIGSILVLSGCNSDAKPIATKSETKATPLETLSADQEQQKELAIEAKDKLFASLLGELMKSMGENGPAKSIGVCKTRAPELATAIGEETGVRIGRTSFKLRSPDNAAPQWAASFVNEHIESPVNVELPNDALGVLLPIRLKATCTICHGTDEQIMPEVKAAIVSNYPDDNAMGFSEGDIRGYFWIEVPGQKRADNE